MPKSQEKTNNPKNIVICSDGTGNSAIKDRGTNVFKIFEAVDIFSHTIDPKIPLQVAIYDDGVGTSTVKPVKIIGGAFGWGLSRNVMRLYAELSRVYEPGDRIYLFGFSRGAFTVRTLAGLILTCGVINRYKCQDDVILKKRVSEAYSEYRERYRTWFGQRLRKPLDPQLGMAFRQQHAIVDETHAPDGLVEIQFIGVWDTVDAVGLPFAGAAALINTFIYRYKFPDNRLNPKVLKACHALAIDDERQTFHPEIWDEEGEPGDRIEQVWFSGVHSNVGGGYPKQGLSLVTLYWMMHKAKDAGLYFSEFDWCLVRDHQNQYDKLYDSRSGFAVYYRYKPRDLDAMCRKHHMEPKIHVTVLERIVQSTDGYAPGNIPAKAQIEVTIPQSGDLKAIPAVLMKEFDPDKILLDRTRLLIRLRHWCHILLILFTVFTIGILFYVQVQQECFVTAVDGLFKVNVLTKFARTALDLPLIVQVPLVAAFVILFLVTNYARMNMHMVYSEAWFKLHTKLRDKLT